MRALEYFEVECPEIAGGDAYRQIAADILLDLDLIKVIGRLHITIEPETPFFLAVGLLRKLPGLARVQDFINVLKKEDKIILDIGDETHLAELLNILWDRFGRDNVEQPDRFTVVIHSVDISVNEIEEMVVFDPGKGMNRDLIYALHWIAPEGFKIRKQSIKGNRFFYIASEDTLPENVVETLIKEKFALIEGTK